MLNPLKPVHVWILRPLLVSILVLLVSIFGISPGWAADPSPSEPSIITADQVIDQDLFLASQQIVINGTVNGNAVLSGTNITINGTITDDVYLVGRSVTLNGSILGDAAVLGYDVTLTGDIAGDLNAAARMIEIQGGIGEDLRVFSQVLRLESTARIGDDVLGAGGSLEQASTSTVAGNLNFTASTVAQDSTESDPSELDPEVGGDLQDRQSSQDPQWFQTLDQAEFGSVTWTQLLIQRLQRLVSLALVGSLFSLWIPHQLQGLTTALRRKPIRSLAWGLGIELLGAGLGIGILGLTLGLAGGSSLLVPDLTLPLAGIGILGDLSLIGSFGLIASFLPQIALALLIGSALVGSVQWISQATRGEDPQKQAIDPLANLGTRLLSLFLGLGVLVALTTLLTLSFPFLPTGWDGILQVILLFVIIAPGLGALRLAEAPVGGSPSNPEGSTGRSSLAVRSVSPTKRPSR